MKVTMNDVHRVGRVANRSNYDSCGYVYEGATETSSRFETARPSFNGLIIYLLSTSPPSYYLWQSSLLETNSYLPTGIFSVIREIHAAGPVSDGLVPCHNLRRGKKGET